MVSGGDGRSDPIEGGRSHSDRTASARARWQFWSLVIGAIVVSVGVLLYLSYRNSHRESSDAYQAYIGHRWYLQLPTSSSGFIEFDEAGVFKTEDTRAEYLGTYRITAAGKLVVRWAGAGSTGTPFFDQTVVDALAPINDLATQVNAEKTMVIQRTSATSFSLDVDGHTLLFAR